MERWAAIPDFEGKYEVSDLGRVRSVATGKCFATAPNSRGYHHVGLYRPKPQTPKTCKVHRLVAAAFIPNPDGLPDVNHLDGDKGHNAAANLEWTSPKLNMIHAITNGRQTALTNPNKRYKLTPEDVAAMRKEYDPNARGAVAAAAKRFGIDRSTALKILRGLSWYDPSHNIPPPPPSRGTRSWRRPKRNSQEHGTTPAVDGKESTP